MSICRARLRNSALTFRMSGEQIRLQVPPKLFGVNSWIAQMIRQWILDCWSGDRKCAGSKSAAANSRNRQFTTKKLKIFGLRHMIWGHYRYVVGDFLPSFVCSTYIERFADVLSFDMRLLISQMAERRSAKSIRSLLPSRNCKIDSDVSPTLSLNLQIRSKVSSGVTRGWRGEPPRMIPSRGWHPTKIKIILCLNLERTHWINDVGRWEWRGDNI